MSNTRRVDESGTSTSAIGNRLGAELSPYLLQHADNPVDWYPWGEEAFERARREDRPIFLSIGYSTCHWCHVMEHESFEDEEVAALLNDSFVCIKVDREERPDIDQVYMAVCQMVTGGGGWPLTIIMTPDRRPFFAGTYIPKHSRLGRTGLLDLIPEVRRLWREQRADLLDSAQSITEHLRRTAGSAGRASDAALNDVVLTSVIDTAFHQLESRFDSRHGGFGTSPKFPSPHNLIFLLHFAAARGDGSARMMATTTLGAMRRGGLWDHVGFGFHRYSTDREWLVPHFEKMLYDQAMLLLAFTEAWLDTRKPEHEQAIRELVSYVLRDMTDPKGGFYSAEDADSEGVEGKHYLWSMDQLVEVLGEEDARAAATLWNASTEGNFEEEASGRRTGANILHLTATSGSGSADVLEPQRVASIRQRLFSARCRRVYPLKDDKILADWNGLMAAALAKAGAALGEPAWIDEADRAVSRVLEKLRDPSGRLLHRMRDGVAVVPAFLDDHVFLTLALIELHQARLEPRYLEQALSLQQETLERFWDRDHGGLFVTAAGSEELLVRPRELYDGAIPSGASVAVANLLRLARLTGDTSLAEHADALVRSALAELRQGPAAHTALVDALLVEAADPCEVVVAGEPGADDTGKLLATVRGRYLPGAVLLLVPPGPEGERIHAIAPFTLGHSPIEGRAAAYVCRDHRCDLPVTDPGNLAELLDSPSPAGSSTAS